MANEVTLNATLQYADSEGTRVALAVADALFSVGAKLVHRDKQRVETLVQESVRLGEFTALGWCLLENLDTTNYINVYTSNSGVLCAVLKPGGGCFLAYLGSGMQAPYVLAVGGNCQMEILIISQ